jgi:hypothetical protein
MLYFLAVRQFGVFSPVLVYCVKKNLAALQQRCRYFFPFAADFRAPAKKVAFQEAIVSVACNKSIIIAQKQERLGVAGVGGGGPSGPAWEGVGCRWTMPPALWSTKRIAMNQERKTAKK